MFTNGFSTLQMPKDFEAVNTKDEFNELYLVNTKIPMSIKFSTTPTLVGLPEIRADIEKNLENNDKIGYHWFFPKAASATRCLCPLPHIDPKECSYEPTVK